jgi:DNA polymerase I-like protein with 3'-5' exonuclease and polymerase domains
MIAPGLFARLSADGVRLRVDRERRVLFATPQEGEIRPELLDELRGCRDELLELLLDDPGEEDRPAGRRRCPTGNDADLSPDHDDGPHVHHRVVRNAADLAELVDLLLADPTATTIAVDAEWHGDYPTEPGSYLRTIQVSWKPGHAACVVLNAPGGAPAFDSNPAAALPHLRRLLTSTEDRSVRIVGHFFRADLPWLIDFGLDLRAGIQAPADDEQYEGWERTRTVGGFDTGLAVHSCDENAELKLEALAQEHCQVPDYGAPLRAWRQESCEENGIKESELAGYGDCPDEVLVPYGNFDADATRRLFEIYNRPGGLLDRDGFGRSSRRPFWIAMRATLPILEMEMTGLRVSRGQLEQQAVHFRVSREDQERRIREWADWPTFNHRSVQHCREFLFGEALSGRVDRVTGQPIRIRPEGARSLALTPVKTSKKPAHDWSEIVERCETTQHGPSTDKETLSILASGCPQAGWLRDLRFIDQVLKTVLHIPTASDAAVGRRSRTSLIAHTHADGRIRTHFFQTLVTGRYSSSRPPLQNIGKRREVDYERILGTSYLAPLRSAFEASPGHVLVEADYVGAELAAMAWLSGDEMMIEHVRRNGLPDGNPEHYDIHSNVAVRAFRLECQPTKQALMGAGSGHLRSVAKTVVFGIAYGRGPRAIRRSALEEGTDLSVDEAQGVIDAIFDMYPKLRSFFDACRGRASHPGWLENVYGRRRRFHDRHDPDQRWRRENQAKNFPVQSLIADAISRSLDKLHSYRETDAGRGLGYRIVLQIHDSVVLEVPVHELRQVVDEVIPACLIDAVPIIPRQPDGTRVERGPYHFAIETEVFERWGIPLGDDELRGLEPPV